MMQHDNKKFKFMKTYHHLSNIEIFSLLLKILDTSREDDHSDSDHIRSELNKCKRLLFLEKLTSTHPSLYFNNATVRLSHAEKDLGLQLDNKMSFSNHKSNNITKTTKDTMLLRKTQLIFPRMSFLINYKNLILTVDMLLMTNRTTHHFQIKLNHCNITQH